MSADTVSKDRILDQFSASAHNLADDTVNTLRFLSYAIAGIVFVIVVLLVIVVCSLTYTTGRYSWSRIVTFAMGSIVILAIVLIIAVESSVASASEKANRLADNATNVVSSQQATDLLNDVASVYNSIAL